MKTLELKLKKDVLIVEIPRLADYEFINRECKYLKVGKEEIKLNASTLDKFEVLCKGSELTEEIASELVDENRTYTDSIDRKWYINFLLPIDGKMYFDNALESFISAVESKGFYWLENPVKIHTLASENADEYRKKWQKVEEKTFKNPLIFVKK